MVTQRGISRLGLSLPSFSIHSLSCFFFSLSRHVFCFRIFLFLATIQHVSCRLLYLATHSSQPNVLSRLFFCLPLAPNENIHMKNEMKVSCSRPVVAANLQARRRSRAYQLPGLFVRVLRLGPRVDVHAPVGMCVHATPTPKGLPGSTCTGSVGFSSFEKPRRLCFVVPSLPSFLAFFLLFFSFCTPPRTN